MPTQDLVHGKHGVPTRSWADSDVTSSTTTVNVYCNFVLNTTLRSSIHSSGSRSTRHTRTKVRGRRGYNCMYVHCGNLLRDFEWRRLHERIKDQEFVRQIRVRRWQRWHVVVAPLLACPRAIVRRIAWKTSLVALATFVGRLQARPSCQHRS